MLKQMENMVWVNQEALLAIYGCLIRSLNISSFSYLPIAKCLVLINQLHVSSIMKILIGWHRTHDVGYANCLRKDWLEAMYFRVSIGGALT